MEKIFSDTNTYTVLQRNSINKLIGELKKTLKRWFQSKFISDKKYLQLNSRNAILPRTYGLPKIHKNGFPLRIIFSSTGSPLHNLATFLQHILRESLPAPLSCCKNSFDLINKLKDIHIPDGFGLVSLDFTFHQCCDRHDSDCHRQQMEFDRGSYFLAKNEFLDAVRLVLDSMYFKFNNKIYKQTYGAPMGSPLSFIVADLVLQNLESHILDELSFISPFYIRYVDDIALAAPCILFDELLDTFNSFHPRLKFTMEVGGSQLNFLELSIIIRNSFMIFDWYQKLIFSERIFNYFSQYPITQKRGVIMNLIDKVFISHPDTFNR